MWTSDHHLLGPCSNVTSKLVSVYDFQFEITWSVGKQFARTKRVLLAIQHHLSAVKHFKIYLG